MKRPLLLLLGGLGFLRPVIETAHRLGLRVATLDYLPDNEAHKFSDLYYDVSVTDFEGVLEVARSNEAAGIMAFAVDPAVETAARVCNRLGLPAPGPDESVHILQHKPLFRKFLQENGFNTPKWLSVSNQRYEDIRSAMKRAGLELPVIVKPADGAGSKGVSLVKHEKELPEAARESFVKSRCGEIIIEEYIEAEGYPSGSEVFSVDGKLEFCSFSAQQFDAKARNPFAPCGHFWPSELNEEQQEIARRELQRLLSLLDMRTSLYNVELRFARGGKRDGELYLMEVSPRGGGNRLAEAIELGCGAPLIENAVRAAVGMPLLPFGDCKFNGYTSLYVIHSRNAGIFHEAVPEKGFEDFVIDKELKISAGDRVEGFTGANALLGTLMMRFPEKKELSDFWNKFG